MSRSESDVNLTKYRSSQGIDSKTAKVSSDDHALSQRFGNEDSQKTFEFDAEIIAERISDWYDSDGAALREYLANAETACIRRAKMELQNSGEAVPSSVVDVLDDAKEKCGYEPLIEVTYNRKSDETRFIIEDNGCGITTTEYQVLRNIGYSASHDDGGVGGKFGMGIMSFAQLTGTHGVLKFGTRSFPGPDRTEDAYSVAMYITNLEYLDGSPDEYGTRFEFPAFCEEAKKINIPNKVEEFADGMIVPVLYRDFDSSGNETGRSDDFLPTRMEDDYDDDATVVVYEDEFFKAVMSPEYANNRRGVLTYNISMPIRRNEDAFGSDNNWDAPWQWDYRGKREDGPIVSCPSNESIVGLIPKEDSKYENLMGDLQEKCIRMSEVPDDAVVMPEPASSRDSFKSGHDDFWQYVGSKMNEMWAEVAKEHFTGLDSWDDFMSRDRAEKKALFRAYSHFGPQYGKSDPSTIQETLEDTFGVTVPEDVCENLDASRGTVNVVRRDSHNASRKRAARSKKIWEVMHEAPDGVYVAKSPSQKKCDIAWGLGDTHVVRVNTYDKYENDWGWKKLKDLPSFNLAEKLPELDQSVIDKHDGTRGGGSSGGSGRSATAGGNGRDPTTYTTKVRYSTGNSKFFRTHNAESLKESLEDGETFAMGKFKEAKYLVIRSDDESARDVARQASKSKMVAATRLPKYVYEYFKGTNNVYESYDELLAENIGATITVGDSQMDLQEIPENYCLVGAGGDIEDHFEGRPEELVGLYGYDTEEWDHFHFVDGNEFNNTWDAETEAKVFKTNDSHGFDDFNDYIYKGTSFSELYREDKLSSFDKDSKEYEALFEYRYGKPEGEKLRTLIDIAVDAGLADE